MGKMVVDRVPVRVHDSSLPDDEAATKILQTMEVVRGVPGSAWYYEKGLPFLRISSSNFIPLLFIHRKNTKGIQLREAIDRLWENISKDQKSLSPEAAKAFCRRFWKLVEKVQEYTSMSAWQARDLVLARGLLSMSLMERYGFGWWMDEFDSKRGRSLRKKARKSRQAIKNRHRQRVKAGLSRWSRSRNR